MSVQLEGFDELMRLVNELEKVPQKVATKAARLGAQMELTATRRTAPVYDGWLKAALNKYGEKSKTKGKKVYEITFDRAYNQKLVKFSKTGKRSYYPISQEFGYKLRNGIKMDGLHYMKDTAQEIGNDVEQKMVDVAKAEIQKILDTAR